MNITKESFGGTMGDVFDLFESLETEKDFKQFYKAYFEYVEEVIKKEKGTTAGDNRPIGDTYERVCSNLFYLLSRVSEKSSMKPDFARKVWWFL